MKLKKQKWQIPQQKNNDPGEGQVDTVSGIGVGVELGL